MARAGRCWGSARQHVRAARPGEGMLHGTVAIAERLGAETVVDLRLKDGSQFIASFGDDRVFDVGERVDLEFNPTQAHLFAPEEETATPH